MKETFGLIVTSRSFFPAHLIKEARDSVLGLLDSMGYGCISVDEDSCRMGAVQTHEEALIDVNAGPIAMGQATIQDVGTELFYKIINVASGREQSFAEKYKLHNDLCIFNPAPIT